jgi:hypothetical protein
MRVTSNDFVVLRSASSALIGPRMYAPESIVKRSGNAVSAPLLPTVMEPERIAEGDTTEQSEFNFFQISPKVSFGGAEIASVRAAKRCPNAKRME